MKIPRSHTLMSFLSALDHTLFPRRCPACRTFIDGEGILCSLCESSLWAVPEPVCRCCGIPFPRHARHQLCGACFQTPPMYDQARASFFHGAAIRDAIYQFKFGPSPGIGAQALLSLCMSHGAPPRFPFQNALVVPVPLHPRKQRKRTFNQSALLARAIARAEPHGRFAPVLERIKVTDEQRRLSVPSRQKNVRGAFQVRSCETVRERDVFLVDDILTTGATIQACAKALRKGGAKRIHVWTISRALPNEEFPETWPLPPDELNRPSDSPPHTLYH